MHEIKIKRVYDEASEDDGYRILIDRLWPRGISKERIKIDKWAKEITPSTALRKTFSQNQRKWLTLPRIPSWNSNHFPGI
jgi:uncharacterized protein YeaO (DUF488 family)